MFDCQPHPTALFDTALPSALATARHIEDINHITYPEGIKRPKIELNVNAQNGKFRYDRDFLLQFMNICKEKPENLLPLDVLELKPSETSHTMSPDGSSGRSRASNSMSTTMLDTALSSALATARYIEDINRITYPEGIKRPKVELNVNAQNGKFRYDRDFLLQFRNICKEKPENLLTLDKIGLEPSETSPTMSRGGSSGRSRAANSMSIHGNVGSAPLGLGIASGLIGKSVPGIGFQMGQFSTSVEMSSEERFLAAAGGRSASDSDVPLGGRPPTMVRTAGRDRIRSKRGANKDPVAPLEVSANRWVAWSTRRGGSGVDSESPEVVERKVKGLLNKLTMERFDSISDQIIAWANKSEKEKDGQTLLQVVMLVFENATDGELFSETYARLCRKMVEQIGSKVQDDGIKNSEGKPFTGGNLFRKYFLNRCQEDFERGWVAKEAAAAAFKATADRTIKEANEKPKGGEESELFSDEYYAAAKAKRRGLGLIRFMGELFKLQILTERMMHKYIRKVLGTVECPEGEEIESLCKLLTTVGSLLDTQKARAHLDVYFSRMRELTKNKNVNTRMVFMLQDVIDLRERKWIPRNAVAAPTTISQFHAPAAKEKLAQEKDAFTHQNASMSRGNRDVADAPHTDGWSVAGLSPTRAQPKVGDLSQFGKINKVAPMLFAPTSVFNKGDPKSRDPPMSRTAASPNMNMFTTLQSTSMGSGLDSESPEVVKHQVKALLNELTMERFDSISNQIIAWANKSENEKDGRTLIQVVMLVLENATDDESFSEISARLCRKMMEQISPKVQDHGLKNSEGKPFAGGNLFRKYLLNRCQEVFERGWVTTEATAAAAFKSTADRAVKEANEKPKGGDESELHSDEYSAAAKAKRRGLGLIRFMGELFKLQMLTERIMHECIKKLLGNMENPEEEEIESLCKLLTTIGSLLDTKKARAHFDVCFSRIRGWTKNKNVNARMVFMLQDVIDLRERKWIPCNSIAAPTTIAQVHEAAAKEKLAQEKDAFMRQNASMSRGSRDVADAPHPDGWSVVCPRPARSQPKAGDLSQFGKINKVAPMSFAPTSVLHTTGDPLSRDLSPTASSSNMFSMLQSSDAIVDPPTSKSSRPPSRKHSVDLGVGGPPEPVPPRRKLKLLPRIKPVRENSKATTPAASEAGPDDEATGEGGTPPPAAISEEEAKSKIDEDVKEFFTIRMLDEAETYFSSLPTEHRHRLVDTLVMKSIDMKDPDVELVGDLFIRVREKNLCSPALFEEGFSVLAELLEHLAVDMIPKAWSYFVILLKGSGLDQDEERYARIAEKTKDPDRLGRLL